MPPGEDDSLESGNQLIEVKVSATSDSGHRDEVSLLDDATLDEGMGESEFSNTLLGNGGIVSLTRFVPEADMTLSLEPQDDKPLVNLVALIAGETTMRFPGTEGFTFTPSRGFGFRYIGEGATFDLKAGHLVRSMGVNLPMGVFESYLDFDVPKVLQPLIAPLEEGYNFTPFPISKTMRIAIAQMIAPGLTGNLRRLQMESAALQLITMIARSLQNEQDTTPKGLSGRERLVGKEAYERLEESLREPPTLSELASAVNVSDKRLNMIFREMYNATVFEVLRDMRLEQARSLLATGDMSVKEIAWTVGYAHVTNFTTAFAAKFGAPPATFAKSKRNSDISDASCNP